MNGGYIMIYKNSKKIYLELFACLTLGKPILWYEDKNTCFFIDTISGGEITTEIVDDEEVRTYGDIILTKGGMTITITAENVVSEVGDIQPSIDSVKANPTLSGDEDDLTGLEVNGVKYAIPEGDSVIANPTLSGDEGDLTGLEVNGVKYAIPSGGETKYHHRITWASGNFYGAELIYDVFNNSDTAFTPTTFCDYINDIGAIDVATSIKINSVCMNGGNNSIYYFYQFFRYNTASIRINGRVADGSGVNHNLDSTGIFKDVVTPF